MATEYVNNDNELVFLNSKNIAQKQEDIDRIQYNAIPSLSLFNDTYTGIAGKMNDIELSANGISSYVNYLCSEISTAINNGNYASNERVEQLSTEFKDISASLKGAVTVIGKDGSVIGNDLSVRKLTNVDYDQLVNREQIQPNTVYVIDDYYESMRNKVVKNLGAPVDSKDAATKEYVDTSIQASEQQLIPSFEQLSTIAVLSSKTYADETFVAVDNVDFKYFPNIHSMQIIYGGKGQQTSVLSIDTTELIKSRIIDHINIDGNTIYIYWRNSTGQLDSIDIPLTSWVQFYKSGDGIDITSTPSGFEISCTSDIARTADLTAYQPTGDYITPTILQNQINALSDYYISKTATTTTAEAVVTRYAADASKNGGIVVERDPLTYATAYRLDSIQVTRPGITESVYYTYDKDQHTGIVRFDDLNTGYLSKQTIQTALANINANSTYNDILDALIALKTAVQ